MGRLRFEQRARAVFPRMTSTRTGKGKKAEVVYRLTVPVPEYEPQRLTIRIADLRTPSHVQIEVDGPQASAHRYSDGTLCIWHPDDPEEGRWVPADGLLALIQHAQLHCWREAYYRETGEWTGPEASHSGPKRSRR